MKLTQMVRQSVEKNGPSVVRRHREKHLRNIATFNRDNLEYAYQEKAKQYSKCK